MIANHKTLVTAFVKPEDRKTKDHIVKRRDAGKTGKTGRREDGKTGRRVDGRLSLIHI